MTNETSAPSGAFSIRLSLLAALVFFTRLPMARFTRNIPETDFQQAWHTCYLWLPVIGLLIGLLLSAFLLLLHFFPAGPQAFLILTLWAGLTGFLHLDGLADTADGWLGGLGSKHRTLEIMHDSRNGTGATVAVSLLLLGKFACLGWLLEQATLAPLPFASLLFAPLLFAPVLPRCAAILLLLSTPPATPQSGLASTLKQQQRPAILIVLASLILYALLVSPYLFLTTLALVTVGTVLLRSWMLSRLGGCTGDTCGATIEINELLFLLGAVGVQAYGQ